MVAPAVPSWRARRAYLKGLTLDRRALPARPEQPTARDFVICGLPRSGTTLLSAALHQPPEVVTLMEPWDGLVLPPAELFRHVRRRLRDEGTIGGRIDLDRLVAEGSTAWVDDHPRRVEPPVDPDTVAVGVKWPSYWQLLDLLPDTRFLVCVRDPAEVISSFVGARGALRDGLELDVAFHADLNAGLRVATRRRADRRALLYETIVRGMLPHLDRPNVKLVRFERWQQDPEALLAEVGAFLGVDTSHTHVRIRPTAREVPRLSPRERRAIARLCPSATALGYRTR